EAGDRPGAREHLQRREAAVPGAEGEHQVVAEDGVGADPRGFGDGVQLRVAHRLQALDHGVQIRPADAHDVAPFLGVRWSAPVAHGAPSPAINRFPSAVVRCSSAGFRWARPSTLARHSTPVRTPRARPTASTALLSMSKPTTPCWTSRSRSTVWEDGIVGWANSSE